MSYETGSKNNKKLPPHHKFLCLEAENAGAIVGTVFTKPFGIEVLVLK